MIHILNQDDEIIDYFDINDGTVLEPDLIRNIENLEDTLEFSVATKRSINVQDRNRVIIKDNEGEYREFIIMQYESNLDGFTDVSCVGSHLEDFQTAKPYKPQKLERYTTNEALSFMAADTGWEVAPDNEWNGLRTTSWSSWKDRLSLIKQLQTTYDMRLSFYVELGTNTVKHRYVKLVEVNPMFNGEEIVYGENMIDLKRTVDFTDVATALIAIGPEDNDGNRLIIEEVDNAAQNQLGLPYRYLWQIYEPESDQQNMTEARLRTLARTKLNKIKTASVEYTIQSTQLDVKVGDMIRVKNEDFTPELYVEAEVIEIKYNAYTKLCDYKFGILTEYTRAEVYERFNALLETLRERLNNIKYDTENVINERLEEELAGLERYIEKSPTPPLNPQEGDLWLDTSHDQVAVLKRYENGKWVKSSVTEAHEVNAPTKEEALYTMLQERRNRLNNDFISNYGLFNTLTAHKYYEELDADIKNMLFDLFVDQTNKYSAFESDFDYINEEQPTIGLILAAMESALRFEDSSNKFKTGYNTARAALDAYLEILRSQYTDEKYLDALNEVADKFGLDVVDGKLLGDTNFIENMEEIKKDLQQQLNDAKKALEDLEVGGRNYFSLSAAEKTGGIVTIPVEPNTDYIVSSNVPVPTKDTTLYFNGITTNTDGVWLGKSVVKNSGDKETMYVRIYPNREYTSELMSGEYKIMWEKGNVATDWTPAPEDTDNKITNINQSITNIEGQLKSTVNKDTFDLLNKTVTQQGTTLEQTAVKLSSKAEKSVVDTLSWTVKNHGTQLTQTAEELASKADKTLLDKATDTIKQQGTLINQNATDIALRAKTSDLNSVTGRVTKAEAAIKVNAGEISSRVKDVDYQTDKTGIIGRLSGAESSITQQSKLISSKVSSTELTQAIDDVDAQIKANEDRIIKHDTKFEQTDTQLSLKATMTDVNKSDKTLSQALSELIIDSSNGLKFSYDSNGRLASYSVGKDGIQFDGSKIVFKASDSIMLQITDAKKAGTDAQDLASDANSKIDNLDLSGTNLVSGTNFAIKENVDRLDTPIGGANYTSEDEYLLVLHRDLSANANFGLRTFRDDFKLKQNAEYTLSFEAYSNENADEDFTYVFLYRYGASNQGRFTMDKELIGTAGGSTGADYDLYRYTATFKNTTGTELANLLIATKGTGYSWFRIKNVMLTRGKVAVPYNVQGHKVVDTDSLIPTINGDKNGWTITGSKIDLVGDVDIVNGNTRIKNLNLNNATVTGGSGKNTITLNNNELISHGLFTRTWAGQTDSAELNLGISQGRIMVSNENTGYNLYFTEKGLSTTMAGATAGYSAGTLEFHSQRFNEVSRGVTLHSTFGTVALLSDESTIVTRSRLTNNIESTDASVYIRPTTGTRPGTNEYQFYVKDNPSGQDTDGVISYGSGVGEYGSGLRFRKSAGTSIIYATNRFGDIGTGMFWADMFVGTGVQTSADNLYAMVNSELRVTSKAGLSGGNITYKDVALNSLNMYGSFSNHSGSNVYFGVGTQEMRVTDNNRYNGGNITYRDVRMDTLHTHGGFQNHSGAGFVYFGVGGAAGMRITNNNLYNGGNIGWRDIEFRNWKANSHEKYKKDIKEWNTNVLDVFKNELQLYQYKYKDNLENNMIHRGIVLREDGANDKFPAEWRQEDGYNGNEVIWWTVKGVQELAQENYKKDEIIKEQGAKIEELEKQMSEVMQLLKNK